MPRTKLQDFPLKENTVTEPKQVVVNPLFAKPNALAGILEFHTVRSIVF